MRRNDLQTVDIQKGTHAGLILARYLQEPKNSDARKELHEAANSATTNSKPLYAIAFNRWKNAWKLEIGQFHGAMKTFEVDQRMIIGLGSDNVLEAGLTLHQTYGVPYIPGSAIKGLCSHYCDEVLGELDGQFKNDGELHKIIFGDPQSRGFIIFHDAWIFPDSLVGCLKPDVMTPHHQDYYTGTDDAPTEFDSPVPVPFLSVSGKFLFVLSCEQRESDTLKPYVNLVWKILASALCNYGIGGKTSSGYGFFFDPVKRENEERERRLQEEQELESQRAEEVQRKLEEHGLQVHENPVVICPGTRVRAVRIAPKKDGKFLTADEIECRLTKKEIEKATHIEVGTEVELEISTQVDNSGERYYAKFVQ